MEVDSNDLYSSKSAYEYMIFNLLVHTALSTTKQFGKPSQKASIVSLPGYWYKKSYKRQTTC